MARSSERDRSRRGQGSGGAYQRSSDGLWVASLDLGWDGGKRKRKYFYARTEADVLAKLALARADQLRGKDINPDRISVADFLKQWLEDDVRPNVEPRTYESYESIVRLHLIPELGRHQLVKLTPRHVQTLLRVKRDAGLSPRTVAYIRAVLRIALSRAERWELVPRNVADLVDTPKQRRIEITPWTPEEAMRFLEVAHQDRLGALFTVALAIGLRKGEALGLRWDDVDLENRRLIIRHQLQRTKAHGLVLKAPKTDRSRRSIALPDQVVTALRQHRIRQHQERLLAGARWVDSGLVFTTTIGTPIEPTNVNKRFAALVSAAGVPRQRFHDQRHWCATLLLAQGLPPRLVMDLLGHTQISTTMDLYGHVLDEDRRRGADLMDALFTGQKRASSNG